MSMMYSHQQTNSILDPSETLICGLGGLRGMPSFELAERLRNIFVGRSPRPLCGNQAFELL